MNYCFTLRMNIISGMEVLLKGEMYYVQAQYVQTSTIKITPLQQLTPIITLIYLRLNKVKIIFLFY